MRTGSRRYWTLRFTFGLAVLLASGAGMVRLLLRPFGLTGHLSIDVLVGMFGFWFAFTSVGPMVRALADDARLRRAWGQAAHGRFARSSTAQQVFQLLFSVAAAAGRAGTAERELVRHFLLQRFVSPAQAEELRRWEADAVPLQDLGALARSVARGLDPGECATLYSWCCLIARHDGILSAREHSLLQQIARGLGIDADHARLLFVLAEQLRRAQGAQAAPGAQEHQGRSGARTRSTGGAARPRPADRTENVRRTALRTLDLPDDASADVIRRRHRELVKRFHPDAQPNLGPVALREATERFQAIQRAYEILTA